VVDEHTDHPVARRVFGDVKATKKMDFIPNVWRALASHPGHLELCWKGATGFLNHKPPFA
jgi:hypothetical protein